MSPRISRLDGVLEAALKRAPYGVVVAAGHDPAALSALLEAERRGLAHGILVGDPGLIGPALDALPERLRHAEIVDAPDEASAVRRAVELVRSGEGQILLKGKTQTGTLLHAVLDRETGLRTGRLLSDCFLFECPCKDGVRLVCITDGGINLNPDLQVKRQILENAVELYNRLGFARPRVAVLSAVESVLPGHGPSMDAAALARMAHCGILTDCEVEGPLSLDLAISPEAVAKKGHKGDVAGRADILLCPEIVSANLLAKSTTYFAKLPLAHVIMGAAAPVLIPSRSDTPEAKMYSIALGALTVKHRSAAENGAPPGKEPAKP
jgi:phosphate butyryltransferase